MQLRPDRGPGKAESAEGKKTLFVGNLPGEVDEDSLSSLFAEIGFVSSARVERTADGASKGWGCADCQTTLVLMGLSYIHSHNVRTFR